MAVEDVTGKGAGKAKGISVQQAPRRTGARFALRGKALVIGLIAGILCLSMLGIYINAQKHKIQFASKDDIQDQPGLSRPDLSSMQRVAPPVAPASVASGPPTDCEQFNNSPWPCAPKAVAASMSDAEKKYKQWLVDQRYKIMENNIAAEQAALQAGVQDSSDVHVASDRGTSQTNSEPAEQQQPDKATRTPGRSAVLADAGTGSGTGQVDLQHAYLKSLGVGGNGSGVDANKAWQQDAGNHGSAGGYLPATRQDAVGDYELFAGSIIPAVMVTGIDSDLPGTITASVRRTVYDSRDPTVVLVPQGAKLVGEYNSMVQYGQERLMVIWNELIFPDGSTLDLKGMAGVDKLGEAGFYDQVNNHYLRVFGSAILISLFGAAAQLSQPQNSSMLTSPNMTSQATANLATQLDSAATNILNKNLSIAPTLNIRPGYPFNVMVNRTIILQPWAKD